MELGNWKLPRMLDWILLTVASMAWIHHIKPDQIQIVIYKIALIAVAVCLSYWADRGLYARLAERLQGHMNRDIFSAARVLARAIVFYAIVVGVTQGL